jgi:adenylyltransferase/sulfurtransferase
MMAISFRPLPEGRHDRQRLIEWWDQDRIAASRIVVAGAGAIGNEVLKLLALLGVGSVLVVDFDSVARSNLARTVLFREADVDRGKAEVAAERARQLNPDLRVAAINGDVGRDLSLGMLARADLVLGGLDNLNARLALNRRCMLIGVPWLNAGITAMDGQVTRYVPGQGACYGCTFSESMARRMNERYSCTGLVRRIPDRAVATTAIGASVTAALQVNDTVCYLHDSSTGLRPGHRLSISLQTHRMVVDELPCNPDCETHRAVVRPDARVEQSPDVLSARDLVEMQRHESFAFTFVELGFDVVESLGCLNCETREIIGRPASLVYEDEAFCPQCRAERTVVRASQIGPHSALWEVPLGRLGVANREWLRLSGSDHGESRWVQLGGTDPWELAIAD